jgi:hypothetical protein
VVYWLVVEDQVSYSPSLINDSEVDVVVCGNSVYPVRVIDEIEVEVDDVNIH